MTKIITIAQQKGGAGKTTVTANIAIALFKKNKNIGVIDTDKQSSLSTWFRLREEMHGANPKLECANCDGYGLEAQIKNFADKDFIIIDSPPHIENGARNAIRFADLVIMPVQPSPTDLWATRATIEIANQENVTAKILLNRVSGSSNLGKSIRGVFEKSAPEYLLKSQLGNRVSYAATMLDGKAIAELPGKTPATQEVDNLIKEIQQVLKPAKAEKPTEKKPVKATAKKTTKPKAVKTKAKTKAKEEDFVAA